MRKGEKKQKQNPTSTAELYLWFIHLMRFSTFDKMGESQENKLINPIDAANYWTDGVCIF